MRYETAFYDRMQCSREKKKECVKLIASVISLAEKARRMGLLVLEDDLPHLKDPLLKKGLQLVVDGTDPVLVRDILSVLMHSSNYKGIKLLKTVITIEGVLSIQSGDNPRIVADKLSVFLGKDVDLWNKYWNKQSQKHENESMITDEVSAEAGLHTEETMPPADRAGEIPVSTIVGNLKFDQLADFNDGHIQKILRETDTQDLARALKGCSGKVGNKIFKNMSQRAAVLLKEDVDYMGPVRVDDVVHSQEKILNVALKLATAGEILIPDGTDIIE
jgi:hypothetical protein